MRQTLPCEKGSMSLPISQVDRLRPGSGPSLPKGGRGMQRGVSKPAGLAGHRLAYVPARDTFLVASAQVCGSGSWLGAMPSPHRSGSKPPFSAGLPRKPFASFSSPLINAPSICHLRPPLPTLSRGLPRTASKSSTACLLPASSWLPVALPATLPRPQPLSHAGPEQSEPRIDQERGKPQMCRPAAGCPGKSHRIWGRPRLDPRPLSGAWSSLCPLSSEVLWGFFSFFLWKVLSDMNRIVESILSDPGSWLPASASPTHSQLTCHVEAPSNPLRRGWDVNSPIPSAPQPPPSLFCTGSGWWGGVGGCILF